MLGNPAERVGQMKSSAPSGRSNLMISSVLIALFRNVVSAEKDSSNAIEVTVGAVRERHASL